VARDDNTNNNNNNNILLVCQNMLSNEILHVVWVCSILLHYLYHQ